MNLTPLHDRVIVKPAEAENRQQKAALSFPDTAKEKPMQGKIIAVGNGRIADDGKLIAMAVKAGDTVLYGKYSGTEVTINGDEFLIMRESDIFAIIG